ncbi:hypothetical protein ONR57_21035 [Hoyosella sp. YIM 151337]|uniref:hypothetical protein n=1 Tax=Hoyosella sp. YIM 151337 TaxID=2992742 RepID=UPI002235D97E|nr:hypothetical protein [Hoyosella sp. YIM 151337]MCW4355793.1 hypothetical protein [Hoyosella sp. YIM 151337]
MYGPDSKLIPKPVITMSEHNTAAPSVLNRRELSVLRATRNGRVHLTLSREPELFIDGLPLCDQSTAYALVRAGLVHPVRPGSVGERVPAMLTPDGATAIDAIGSDSAARNSWSARYA